MTGPCIKRVCFFISNNKVGLILDIWPSRKTLKGLLQNIYLIYHKRNPLITAVVGSSSLLKKYLKLVTWEKNVRRYYFYVGITIIKLELRVKYHSYVDEKLFELFCIENDFGKYFAKSCHLLFKYFVSHIIVIPRNDSFLHYRTNQNSFFCIILRNALPAPE